MSGYKRTIPNYQQLYQEQLQANYEMEQRNRENEVRIREQTIIAEQIAASAERDRQNTARIQAQIADAERRAAMDRVRLQEMEQQALQEISGVRVQLQATQSSVQQMQWENRQLADLAAQDRQQIKNQIERSRQENESWQQIAQQERQRIQTHVQVNTGLIERNRQEIEKNRQALETGIKQVMGEINELPKLRRLEEMRNAQAMMDSAVRRRESIPTQWMAQFDPDNYRQAEAIMREAEAHLQNGNYSASLSAAQEGMSKLSDIVARVEARQRDYQSAYQTALSAFDEASKKVRLIQSDPNYSVWVKKELDTLVTQLDGLDKAAVTFDPTKTSIDQCRTLADRSFKLLAEAENLEKNLDIRLRRHHERLYNIRSVIKALVTQGEYRPYRPIFENTDDPNSDILLQTEGGMTAHMEMSGGIAWKFPEVRKPEENRQWLERFNQVCREQGFGQLVLESEELPGIDAVHTTKK
jgi:hypothetical protein